MNYLTQLEDILDSNFKLFSMETYDTDRVIDILTQLSRFSNKAFYMSYPQEGLHRLGAAHITIPRTKTAKELLEHIDASPHYGVYILKDFNYALDDEKAIELLIKIATGDARKAVLMLSEYIELPRSLKPYTMRAKHQVKNTA